MTKLRYGLAMALVAASLTAALAGCSGRRSEQHRLEGDAYLQIRKIAEATDAYKKAVAANPQNAQAKLGLGRCLVLQQKNDEALAEFRGAVEADSHLEAAYAEAVNLLLRTDHADQALALAGQCEAAIPERGGMLHGYALLRLGRIDEALALLTKLRDQFPNSLDVHVNLASAMLAAKQPDKAEEELQAALRIDAKSVIARMVLIDAYRLQGKTAEIVQEFEKLTAEHPDDVSLRLGLARSLVYAGRVDEAQAIAKKVLEQDKASPWANYVMGCCLLEKKQFAEAVPYLQTAEQALPPETDASKKLALAKSGGVAPAEPKAQAAPAAAQPAAAAPSTSANTDWEKLWQQASLARLVADRDKFLATNDPNVKETLLVAALLMRNGPVADQIAALLPADSPFRAFVDVLKKNSINDTLKFFEGWKETDSPRQFLRDTCLGYALARGSARARAVQVFSQNLQTWPDQVVTLYNIAQVFREAGMPEFAAKALQRIIAKTPDNVDAHTALFVMLRDAGMRDQARNAAEAAYNLFPTNRDAVVGLCMAYLDTRDVDMALKVMDRAMQASPDDTTLAIERAVLLIQSGAVEEARKLLESTQAPPNLAGRASMIEALSAAILGDWAKVSSLRDSTDAATLGPALRLLYAAASIKAGEKDKAIKLLTPTEGDRPVAGKVGLILLAALGQNVNGLDPSEAALAKEAGADAETLGTYAFASACQSALLHDAALDGFKAVEPKLGGNVQFLQQMFASVGRALRIEKPVDEARKLAERHAGMAEAWLGLTSVARLAGDVKAEKEGLEKASAVDAKNAEVWRQLGQYAERQGDMKTAGEDYRKILELNPDDPAANNNAAYCLLVTGGDVKEALALAAKAQEKLPSNPEILHTLGVAQLRSGDLEQSHKNLALALELRPADPTLLLDFGLLLIAQDKAEEGKRDIDLALRYADQLGLDFPRRDEAQKALDAK